MADDATEGVASKLIKYYTIIFKDALHKLNLHLSKRIELRKMNKQNSKFLNFENLIRKL